ncbi:MAG: NAD(+)/NADH kinase [Haloquadratum sp.]|nr:NAD(+)/NADH kinase [Haloferacaceae archaeon]MDR9444968.1 NAD(+)/NADH kinase [Haloquadratum sp.]
MHIGFVVNPIAGIGGTVGLKGSDGVVEAARTRGGTPRAPPRAVRFIDAAAPLLDAVQITTVGGAMGAEYLPVGAEATVCATPPSPTDASDTTAAVRRFADLGVDLIVFVGGDGTAVDVASGIRGTEVPLLGVPAGVKIYSGVFASTPEAAAQIIDAGFDTVEAEVLDRPQGSGRAPAPIELQATARTPVARAVQGAKRSVGGSVDGLIEAVVAEITTTQRPVILGPGGTLGQVKAALGIDGTPLGVDVVEGDQLTLADADASALETLVERVRPRLFISPIGGQGFIFGRGNLQLTPQVIAAAELSVIASPQKLETIRVLRVDTDDPTLDASLRGWMRVRTGRVTHELLAVH